MIVLLCVLFIILIVFLVCLFRTYRIKKIQTSFTLSDDRKRTKEYADKLSKMVKQDTISVAGKEDSNKFRRFHKLLMKLFPLVFEKLEYIDLDGNLLLKWKGKDETLDPLMIISHMDVVEATGNWQHGPFSGDIIDGQIWGRGSCDTKSSLMAFLQATEELLAIDYQPNCDVYLGSTCTEEIGGDGAYKIVDYLKEHDVKLWMLADEGGSIVEDPIDGVYGNFAAIGIFEKGYGDLKFIARSNGGHASSPGKDTGIVRLAKFISHVSKHDPFKAQFSKTVEATFNSLAPYCCNFWLKFVMCNLWLFKPVLKVVLPRISSQASAMIKTTCAFTMQKGSDGYNVLPQEAWVSANLRYSPHQGMRESNGILRSIAKKYGLETVAIKCNNSSKVLDMKGPQYALTIKTINEVFPGVGIMPYVVTGGTDSRFFASVCDNCVRFSPINYGPAQMAGMHGINEYLDSACLPLAVDYYKSLIKAMDERMI